MSFRARAAALGLVLVAGGVLALACGDDGSGSATFTPDGGATPTLDATAPPPVSTPTQATATVGTTGGNVKTTTGTGVEIPAGAMTGNVNITVAEAPSLTPSGAVGSAFQFGPAGLPFSAAVTVVLEFDPSKLPAGKTSADIVIMTAPDGTTNFSELTTSVRDATHVSAQTTHFSIFVPVLAGAAIANPDASTGGDDDDDAGQTDDASSDSGTPDAGTPDAGDTDAGAPDDAGADDGDAGDADTGN